MKKEKLLSKKDVLAALDLMINTNGITVASVFITEDDGGKKFLKSIKHHLTKRQPKTTPTTIEN